MEIIEYDKKYDESIKSLLVELQNYLVDIDNWHTLVLKENYREEIFKRDFDLINSQEGKIYLAKENNKIIGFIIGIVHKNDEEDILTNDCKKVGEVLELIVSSKYRRVGLRKVSFK